MTRHTPRKERWSSWGPNEHRSLLGRVYFKAGSWHAAITYQITDPTQPQPSPLQTWDVGGLKRARNAMIVLEDKARILQRLHGEAITIVPPT